MKKKVRKIFVFLVLIGILITVWGFVPVTERMVLTYQGDTSADIRIVLVTDLHSCFYGKDQKALLDRIDREDPDIVIFSGDFFDDKLSDENAKITASDLVRKYPCYYVTGNHEYWSGRVDEMREFMRSIGVTVLQGECSTINIEGTDIDICGVDDPTYMTSSAWKEQLDMAYEASDEDHLRILASHRPEQVDTYSDYDFDLILTGHAHAGQIRIPFLNIGLFAPDQGVMAKYVSGKYTLENGSIMIVSRGLARESTPLPRVFNHPEIVSIEVVIGP